MFVIGCKLLGGGLATISIGGAGIGIGTIFASFIQALSANPEMEEALFTFTILGFALTEAIALFGLMVAFMIMFS